MARWIYFQIEYSSKFPFLYSLSLSNQSLRVDHFNYLDDDTLQTTGGKFLMEELKKLV